MEKGVTYTFFYTSYIINFHGNLSIFSNFRRETPSILYLTDMGVSILIDMVTQASQWLKYGVDVRNMPSSPSVSLYKDCIENIMELHKKDFLAQNLKANLVMYHAYSVAKKLFAQKGILLEVFERDFLKHSEAVSQHFVFIRANQYELFGLHQGDNRFGCNGIHVMMLLLGHAHCNFIGKLELFYQIEQSFYSSSVPAEHHISPLKYLSDQGIGNTLSFWMLLYAIVIIMQTHYELFPIMEFVTSTDLQKDEFITLDSLHSLNESANNKIKDIIISRNSSKISDVELSLQDMLIALYSWIVQQPSYATYLSK